MAAAHVKKYHKCLIENFSKQVKIKKETTGSGDEGEKKELSVEQVDMVMQIYTDVIRSCSDEVNFGIVFNSKSKIFPKSDALMAWNRLKQNYKPQSNAYKVMLRKSFHQIRLKKNEDPDEWIKNLDMMKYGLEGLGVTITEEELVLQIMEGLSSAYDPLVVLLNARNKEGDLTVIELREELKTFYDRQSRRNKKRQDGLGDAVNDETALVAGIFKGRCRGCGVYGHEKANCPQEKQNTNNNGNENKNFGGKCLFCGKRGHKKADCWVLKTTRKRKCS